MWSWRGYSYQSKLYFKDNCLSPILFTFSTFKLFPTFWHYAAQNCYPRCAFIFPRVILPWVILLLLQIESILIDRLDFLLSANQFCRLSYTTCTILLSVFNYYLSLSLIAIGMNKVLPLNVGLSFSVRHWGTEPLG